MPGDKIPLELCKPQGVSGLSESQILGLDVTILEPKGFKEHTATVIWLHGLGDTGRGMILGANEVASKLGGDLASGVKFVMPHAPLMQVTGNSGMVMPSWFDVLSFDIENRPEDEESLSRSAKWVNDLIDIEVNENKIPLERIILGGLSQGGALTCRTLLTTERKIGGIFVLSSYFPLRKRVPELKSEMASQVPIFWAHGARDRQVPFDLSLRTATQLSKDLGIGFVHSSADVPLMREELEDDTANIKVRFMEYGNLGHTLSTEEMGDLAIWLRAILCDYDEKKGGSQFYLVNFGGDQWAA